MQNFDVTNLTSSSGDIASANLPATHKHRPMRKGETEITSYITSIKA